MVAPSNTAPVHFAFYTLAVSNTAKSVQACSPTGLVADGVEDGGQVGHCADRVLNNGRECGLMWPCFDARPSEEEAMQCSATKPPGDREASWRGARGIGSFAFGVVEQLKQQCHHAPAHT